MEALTLNNYSRASMATMLSALPREEQQWTRNFLDSIILVSSAHHDENMPLTSFRGFCTKEKDLNALRRRAMKEKFGL